MPAKRRIKIASSNIKPSKHFAADTSSAQRQQPSTSKREPPKHLLSNKTVFGLADSPYCTCTEENSKYEHQSYLCEDCYHIHRFGCFEAYYESHQEILDAFNYEQVDLIRCAPCRGKALRALGKPTNIYEAIRMLNLEDPSKSSANNSTSAQFHSW